MVVKDDKIYKICWFDYWIVIHEREQFSFDALRKNDKIKLNKSMSEQN